MIIQRRGFTQGSQADVWNLPLHSKGCPLLVDVAHVSPEQRVLKSVLCPQPVHIAETDKAMPSLAELQPSLTAILGTKVHSHGELKSSSA